MYFMKMRFLCLFSVLFTGSLNAQSIKVRRADGQRAIVQFSKDTKPEVGKVYSIGQKPDSDLGALEEDSLSVQSSAGLRDYFIELSNSMPFVLGDGGGLSFSTAAKFGFNLGTLEFAPSFGFSKVTVGDVSATSFNLGLMADVNFIKNNVGETFVPAFTANFGFAKGGSLSFGAGVAGKFYILRQSQSAIRLALRFDGVKVPETDGIEGSGGLSKSLQILEIGIQTYF